MSLLEQDFEAFLDSPRQQHEPVDGLKIRRSELAQSGFLAGVRGGLSARTPNICASMHSGHSLYVGA
jgi:hypothetical protein